MNIKKINAVATVVCCLAAAGCTTTGRPASDYQNLQLKISYSQTFNLEPSGAPLEKIYILTKDLSGRDASDTLKSYIIYSLRTNPNYMITDNPNEADILIFSTIAGIATDKSQGYGGTIAGGLGGLMVGSIADDVTSRSRYDYYGYGYRESRGLGAWLPLIFAGIGAGIGYAVDSSMAINNMVLQENLEVRQCHSGECNSYTTQLIVRGDQLNMNEGEALNTILAHSARGISELIKH